jgi:hypothetical protein
MRGNHKIPSRGDQVEQRRNGIRRIGDVWYSDQLQVLVKWQDGKSSSLRIGRDLFSILTVADEECRSLNKIPENTSARPVRRNSRLAHSGQQKTSSEPVSR